MSTSPSIISLLTCVAKQWRCNTLIFFCFNPIFVRKKNIIFVHKIYTNFNFHLQIIEILYLGQNTLLVSEVYIWSILNLKVSNESYWSLELKKWALGLPLISSLTYVVKQQRGKTLIFFAKK